MTNELLNKLSRKLAWTPDALIDAGIPADQVSKMIASGPRATPERPRVSVNGWKREREATRYYIWGPDIRFHLGLDGRRRTR